MLNICLLYGDFTMRAIYKNSIRSKEMIRKALIDLIGSNKNLSDITVTDIVKTANINRGTFYNHYTNVTEVFEEMKNELIEELSNGLKQNHANRDIDSYIHEIIINFKQNEKTYRQLIDVIPREVFDDMKLKFISQIRLIEKDIDEVSLYFVVNGISGIFLDYIDHKLPVTLDELGEKAIKLIKETIIKH